MKTIAALLCLVVSLSAFAQDDEDVRIRDWEFTWTVVEEGDASFSIVKTDDAIYCRLREDYDSIRMSPENAEAIAEHLAGARDRIDTLRDEIGDQDSSESTQEAGDFRITFSYDTENGGYVFISNKEGFSSPLILDPRDCEDLAEGMANAERYAEIIDERIDP